MPNLRIRSTDQEYRLAQQVIRIGAAIDNDIVVEGEDLDEHQAQVVWDEAQQGYILRVLVEQPAVTVNGNAMMTDVVLLNDGDLICVGNDIELTFGLDEEPLDSDEVAEPIELPSREAFDPHDGSQVRIGCAYCFSTINGSKDLSERKAILGTNNNYYHETCWEKIDLSINGKTVELLPAPPLFAKQLAPKRISMEVDNTLDDKPLGISESRVILRELLPISFKIKNNEPNAVLRIPMPLLSAPWVTATVRPLPDHDGKVVINPDDEATVVLYPHLVRPLKHRCHLEFIPNRYVIVESNGIDWLSIASLSILAGVLLVMLINLPIFAAALSLLLDSDNLLNVFTFFLQLLILTTIVVAFPVYLAPAWTLQLAWKAINQFMPIRFTSNSSNFLHSAIHAWLFSPGLLSHEPGNIPRLILFVIVCSMGISVPLTAFIFLLLLLSQVIPLAGILFYLGALILCGFILYRFVEGYGFVEGFRAVLQSAVSNVKTGSTMRQERD
jgi:pSer/pThr/pTyr-binding forkhead associated (FHA) protein